MVVDPIARGMGGNCEVIFACGDGIDRPSLRFRKHSAVHVFACAILEVWCGTRFENKVHGCDGDKVTAVVKALVAEGLILLLKMCCIDFM